MQVIIDRENAGAIQNAIDKFYKNNMPSIYSFGPIDDPSDGPTNLDHAKFLSYEFICKYIQTQIPFKTRQDRKMGKLPMSFTDVTAAFIVNVLITYDPKNKLIRRLINEFK